LHEIAQVVVGTKGREWWQQREHIAIVAPTSTAAPQHAMVAPAPAP
jgi:hypothetical protein